VTISQGLEHNSQDLLTHDPIIFQTRLKNDRLLSALRLETQVCLMRASPEWRSHLGKTDKRNCHDKGWYVVNRSVQIREEQDVWILGRSCIQYSVFREREVERSREVWQWIPSQWKGECLFGWLIPGYLNQLPLPVGTLERWNYLEHATRNLVTLSHKVTDIYARCPSVGTRFEVAEASHT
jgi:hypothetical protein